jgi:FkbM family methyltransferase
MEYYKKLIRKLIQITLKYKIKRIKYKKLGSEYGSWAFDDTNIPNNFTLLSCGVGEDISFDIEILNSFIGKVYLIDPTPRAITHYNNVKNKFGKKKIINYSKNGNQNVNSYDLRNISKDNLIFIDKAIHTRNAKLKFYKPKNSNFVSHSIFKNKNMSEDFIEVQALDIVEVIKSYNVKNIDILKLDIEGGELQIIEDIFKKKVFPKQILFEFDQIKEGSIKSIFYLYKFFKLIKEFEYVYFYNDEKGNFSIKKITNR